MLNSIGMTLDFFYNPLVVYIKMTKISTNNQSVVYVRSVTSRQICQNVAPRRLD